MAFTLAQHYQLRMEQIRQEIATLSPETSSTVVLLGDSLSEQNPVRELAGLPVVNMGISGDEIEHPEGGVLGRLDLLPPVRPAHVMLLIGINDLNNSGKSVEIIAPRYDALVGAIRTTVPDAELHVQRLFPTRDDFTRLMDDVNALNAEIERIARLHGVRVVDTYSPLQDESGALRSEYTYDGLHLSEAGYGVLNRVLEAHLHAGKTAAGDRG